MKGTHENPDNKFSRVEQDATALCQTMYEVLNGFVHWLSAQNNNDDNIMMSAEEIAGELFLEIVKGCNYYCGKGLSQERLEAILRKMMDNRVSELRYKHYVTHRKLAQTNVSLDSDEGAEIPLEEYVEDPDAALPDSLMESGSLVSEIRSHISDNGRKVFDAVLYDPDGRTGKFLKLSNLRAKAVGRNGRVKITKDVVSNAAVLSMRNVNLAYGEIRDALEAYDGSR